MYNQPRENLTIISALITHYAHYGFLLPVLKMINDKICHISQLFIAILWMLIRMSGAPHFVVVICHPNILIYQSPPTLSLITVRFYESYESYFLLFFTFSCIVCPFCPVLQLSPLRYPVLRSGFLGGAPETNQRKDFKV